MNFILGDGGYFHILLYMFEFCSVTLINYLVSFPSFFFYGVPEHSWWLSGKESAYNAGNARETVAILGLGERNGTHSSILAWEIPWTEELGRLQFTGSKKSWTWPSKHTHIHSVLQLKTHFSVLLKQYNCKYFTQSPVYCKDFPPRLLGTKIITSVLWYPGTVLPLHYKLFLHSWWFHHNLPVSRIKQMT